MGYIRFQNPSRISPDAAIPHLIGRRGAIAARPVAPEPGLDAAAPWCVVVAASTRRRRRKQARWRKIEAWSCVLSPSRKEPEQGPRRCSTERRSPCLRYISSSVLHVQEKRRPSSSLRLPSAVGSATSNSLPKREEPDRRRASRRDRAREAGVAREGGMGSERDLGGDAECGSRACSTGWWPPPRRGARSPPTA